MKLSDFILLDVDEKKLTLLHHGVLIDKRSVDDSLIFLFSMSNYYVESYCCVETKAVREFRVFDSVEPLSPYLDAIRIEGLLN